MNCVAVVRRVPGVSLHRHAVTKPARKISFSRDVSPSATAPLPCAALCWPATRTRRDSCVKLAGKCRHLPVHTENVIRV
jgi:hypothetical protein